MNCRFNLVSMLFEKKPEFDLQRSFFEQGMLSKLDLRTVPFPVFKGLPWRYNRGSLIIVALLHHIHRNGKDLKMKSFDGQMRLIRITPKDAGNFIVLSEIFGNR